MDIVTHAIFGAAVGEALLGKKIGRKAMMYGALASAIPDLDVFGTFYYTSAQQLMVHRGFTHSFLFVVITSILIGWLFSKWLKKTEITWKNWTAMFFVAMLSHILVDSLNAYGTGWFEPFSSYRVSFNTVFVADPFYTLPLLFCVVVALIAKNNSPKRMKWNRAGLIISTLYLAFTIINKFYVNEKMQESFNLNKAKTTDFVTTPTLLNNFLWMAYSPDSLGYWFGYYSVFDKTNDIKYYHVNRNENLLSPFANEPSVKILKQFSKGYYCMSSHENDVFFNDIRFGQIGGWDKPDSSFVFSYKLNNNADNSLALNRSKFKVSYAEALSSLINRIKGN